MQAEGFVSRFEAEPAVIPACTELLVVPYDCTFGSFPGRFLFLLFLGLVELCLDALIDQFFQFGWFDAG